MALAGNEAQWLRMLTFVLRWLARTVGALFGLFIVFPITAITVNIAYPGILPEWLVDIAIKLFSFTML